MRLVVYSIRDGLSDVWNTAIRLKDYTTAALPPAADWKPGMVYDSTLSAVKYSDGTNWQRLMVHNGGAALTRPDDTNVTVTLGGSPTTALLAATSLTMGWSGTLALTRGGTGAANAADARTNLGLGTAAVKNTGVSGDAVPVLNGAATTWAAGMTLGGSLSVPGDITNTGSGFDGILMSRRSDAATVSTAIYFDTSTSGNAAMRGTSGTLEIFTGATKGVNGGNVTVTVTTTGLAVTGDTTTSGVFKVGANQVVKARITGWSVDTGTAKRTANATYAGTAEATYTQATIQTLMDAVRDQSQALKALKDDLHATAGHGLIGT